MTDKASPGGQRSGRWPSYSEEEIATVAEILRSGKVNYWTGDEGRSFEREFAEYCGSGHAVAVANGSVALELALHALGIGPGDDVIVTPRTFIASVSSILLVGARPVFADVDRDSQNLSAETVSRSLTPATRAVVAVHLAGWPVEMRDLRDLADEKNFSIVEDCAQAHGAEYRGRKVGALGHISAFSFCADKIISTCGEGGMLTTDDDSFWERAWSYKDHGKSLAAVRRRDHPPGFRWLHESFGTNWRLTEVQAAVGRLQLAQLSTNLERRREIAERLNEVCRDFAGLRTTVPPAHVQHAYYRFYCFVEPEKLKANWDRDRIMQAIAAEGVEVRQGACPEVYLEKAFDDSSLRPATRCPVASELGRTSLEFVIHHQMTDQVLELACDSISSVLQEASI